MYAIPKQANPVRPAISNAVTIVANDVRTSVISAFVKEVTSCLLGLIEQNLDSTHDSVVSKDRVVFCELKNLLVVWLQRRF
jgi:hypothetical protein